MENTEKNAETTEKKEDNLIVKLKDPVVFEGKEYKEIDLTGLHDIKARDMIDINRRMSRGGNVDATPELTLEYALNMANIAARLPLEFFEQLPPRTALEIRGRVTGFLFGRE